MRRRTSGIAGRILLAGTILATAAWAPPREVTPPADLATRANNAIGLFASDLFTLPVPGAPEEQMTFTAVTPGETVTLNLYVQSIRSHDYRLLTPGPDGTLIDAAPGPVRTMRGGVAGEPTSIVAASLLEEGLVATIIRADGRRQWIEPVGKYLDDAPATTHVLYDSDDVVPVPAGCGVTINRALEEAAAVEQLAPADSAGALCTVEIACDSDDEYYAAHGSSVIATEANITSIINTLNAQYELDVGLSYTLTAIVVRDGGPFTDPYTLVPDAEGLLCEFITEWTNNMGFVSRDMAHMFTARALNGGLVLGIAADLGDVCNSSGSCTCNPLTPAILSDGSYCLTVDVPLLANQAELSAHELGHLWGGLHCTCPGFTMNTGGALSGVTQFTPGNITIINDFKDSRTCLDGDCVGAPLTNDTCAGATEVAEFSGAFTTRGTGSDCPALPIACEEGFGVTFGWDIYYRYTASCNGVATASLCVSGFDTRMAVYDDSACPPQGTTDLIGCNDDFCSLQSQMSFAVTAGSTYLIRIGGFADFGDGFIDISCSGPIPCPSDSDGDMDVGITDFLTVLAQWGTVCPCTADADGDGEVGITDFLKVLADWGPCP